VAEREELSSSERVRRYGNKSGQVILPVRLLLKKHGNPTFVAILVRLRCRRCKEFPQAYKIGTAPVEVCATAPGL
jgi:hypothetical protein